MKTYRLFYREMYLGEILEEDMDFPKLFGAFQSREDAEEGPVWDRLQRYIAYSIAADRLMTAGKEEEWEAFVEGNERQFLDLIETNDWYVLDAGKREPILVPIFCEESKIVWRWNVGD